MNKLKVILLVVLMLSACLHPLIGVGAYMLARFLFKEKHPKIYRYLGIASAVATGAAILVAAGVWFFGGLAKFGPIVLVHSMGACIGTFICTALFAVDNVFDSAGKALHAFLFDTCITVHYSEANGGAIVRMKSPVQVTPDMYDAVFDADIGSTALYTPEGLQAASITLTQVDEGAFEVKELSGGGYSLTVRPEASGGREWIAMNRNSKDGGADNFELLYIFEGTRSPEDARPVDFFYPPF